MSNQYSWYGIDFGTTNSAASSMTGDVKESVRQINYGDDEGRPFPSLVAIHKETGRVITGREAKKRRNELEGEYQYFSSIKTIIGEDRSYTIAGKRWTPVDIAAEIFKGLKEKIGKDRVCSEAVVAVPVGFTADKKRNLREAAGRAGIQVKMFISEPTAAFFSNYARLSAYHHVAVFDWGGGTLDVAVLKIAGGKVFELSTAGMSIAGDNIDDKMARKMHADYCEQKKMMKSFDEVDDVSKDLLLASCEEAKIEFSDGEDFVRINMNNYDELGTVRGQMEYEFFAELIDPEVQKAMKCLSEAVEKSGLNMKNIDCILCVGGSSKLRPLREKLTEKYGEKMLFYPPKVMWDIAKGASMISMTDGHYGLNQNIGLILSDGEFLTLLEKSQPLPCQEKNVSLAIVTDEKKAQFVITDSKDEEDRSFVQYITVPAGGFYEEIFELSCFIDDDNLLRMRIRSSRKEKTVLHSWTYDRLLIYYDLEG